MANFKVPYVNFPAQFEESGKEALAAVRTILERGDFILGNEVTKFEKSFAELCGAKHAIGLANGTDTLIVAMKALGIGVGDEVITASNSWISSASSIALIGAKPVFADVLEDQTISPEAVEAAITPRTKAIMPVHLTGRCAQMGKLIKISQKHGIPLIEDAAQAIMARIDGMTAGSIGLIGSFSLHPLKNLNATGDAGILTTNDDALAEKFRLLRNHGLINRDEVVFWGYNSRLDTVQAAILNTRMPLLKKVIERRREIAKRYTAALSNVAQCPVERENEFHTYHVYVAQCDNRNELKKFLEEKGIETKIHYPIPIHLQKAAQDLGYKLGSLPNTEKQAARILSLPVHQYLSNTDVDFVCQEIKRFYLG